MAVVYISGPFTNGDVVENVRSAVMVAEKIVQLGHTPYIPHLSMLWHMIAPHPIEFWYEYDTNFLRKCDCVLRIEGESSGADAEVELAYDLGIPIFYSIHELMYMGYKK